MEMQWIEFIVTIMGSVLASSGLWAFIQKKNDSKDAKTQMLIGLGHDRIVHLGMRYVERGYVTKDEYEDLYNYLYVPYKKLGGNGSAERVMKEVDKLEIRTTATFPKSEPTPGAIYTRL